MSRNVRLSTNLQLVQQVRELMGLATATLCTSAELAVITAAVTTDTRAAERANELLHDPRIAELAQQAPNDAAVRLEHLLGVSADLSVASQPVLTVGLLEDLGETLAVLERHAVTTLAVETLIDDGYTVHHAAGDEVDAIEAWSGDELMLVAVADGGEILSDQAGVDGACADRQARFEEGLRRRGVVFTRTTVAPHDETVSPLIAAAAAAGEASLATALARNGTSGRPRRRRTATAENRATVQHETRGRSTRRTVENR